MEKKNMFLHRRKNRAEELCYVLFKLNIRRSAGINDGDEWEGVTPPAPTPFTTVFKEKQGVWDPKQELTRTSPYVDSSFDSNTFTMVLGQSYARSTLPNTSVNFNPQSGTKNLVSGFCTDI